MNTVKGVILFFVVLNIVGCKQVKKFQLEKYQEDQKNQMIIASPGEINEHLNEKKPILIEAQNLFDEYRGYFINRNFNFVDLTSWVLCEQKENEFNTYEDSDEFKNRTALIKMMHEVADDEKESASENSLLFAADQDYALDNFSKKGKIYKNYYNFESKKVYHPSHIGCNSEENLNHDFYVRNSIKNDSERGNGLIIYNEIEMALLSHIKDNKLINISLMKMHDKSHNLNSDQKAIWSFTVTIRENNKEDLNTSYEISESSTLPGIISTKKSDEYPTGRAQIESYTGNFLTSIIRSKNGKLHGLIETFRVEGNSIVSQKTCYNEGENIISENCDVF